MDCNSFQMHLATVPVIDDILRDGARRALQAAIEREVDEYIQRHSQQVDDQGHRLVVRNGHHPARKIQSGNGPIEVHQPRVNDKRVDEQGQPHPLYFQDSSSISAQDQGHRGAGAMALSERDFHQRFPRSPRLPGARWLGPVAHHHRSNEGSLAR